MDRNTVSRVSPLEISDQSIKYHWKTKFIEEKRYKIEIVVRTARRFMVDVFLDTVGRVNTFDWLKVVGHTVDVNCPSV